MELSGKVLALEIFEEIKKSINLLDSKRPPTLVIITLGSEASWEMYVRQKLKQGEAAKIKTIHNNMNDASQDEVLKRIKKLNSDKNVDGIIVQRPLPFGFDTELVSGSISPQKDVDGFQESSSFEVPVWLAVKHFLSTANTSKDLSKFLQEKNIVVIGKGQSAGKMIISSLKKMSANLQVIDSRTPNPRTLIGQADVIISCVGKKVIDASYLKPGVTLIGVGIRYENGKLRGDYDEEDVKKVASFYTPTPGGVGPLNLAYLFKNVLLARQNTST